MESWKKRRVNSLRRLIQWWLMHKPHGFLRWMWSTLQIILQINQPQERAMA